jgi:hypothetical protein
MWYSHGETEHYLTDGPPVPDGQVLANVSLLEDGRWRWEARQASEPWMIEELDGWWGVETTLEDAKKAAESYLRRFRF